MKFIRDILTGIDGRTYDVVRVALLLSVLAFLFLSGWSVVKHKQEWKPQDFGVGFGAVMAGAGLGLKMKSSTEPGGEPDGKA